MNFRALFLGTAVLAALPVASLAQDFQCASFPDGDFQEVVVEQGKVQNPDFLETLSFADGVAYAKCGTDVYFVGAYEGALVRAFLYDNGPDYFSEGLARTVDDETGLIGYVDQDLNTVIASQFVEATPFKNGQALVSVNGSDANTLWGSINTSGETLVPIEYSSRAEVVEGISAVNSVPMAPASLPRYTKE